MSEGPRVGPRLHVGTSITENYVPHAMRFLDTLNRTPVGDRFCVTFGFENDTLKNRYSEVRFAVLPETTIVNSFGTMPWGGWIDATPWIDNDDMCVFSDADVVIQRNWTNGELERFSTYDANTIGMGSNKGSSDTLGDEAHRIRFVDHKGDYGDWAHLPCFNGGFLIARASVFKRFRKEYDRESIRFHAINNNPSRCQWLMNWIIQTKLKLTIDILGSEIMSLGHFGLPKNCVQGTDGTLRVEDTAVMFCHRIGKWPSVRNRPVSDLKAFEHSMGQHEALL